MAATWDAPENVPGTYCASTTSKLAVGIIQIREDYYGNLSELGSKLTYSVCIVVVDVKEIVGPVGLGGLCVTGVRLYEKHPSDGT